jgi:ATP-dependent helicase HrpA
LNQLDQGAFDWLVPGLRREKVTALIKALPKALRRHFVPAPDYAAAVLQAANPSGGSLQEAVRRELQRIGGVEVPIDAWDTVELPPHLTMNFKVIDAGGKTLAVGKNLEELRHSLGGRASRQFEQARPSRWERAELRRWDFGELPEAVEFTQNGVRLRGYPALVDEGSSVRLRLADSPAEAERLNRAGIRRLFMLELPQQTKYLRRNLPHLTQMCLYFRHVGSCDELQGDLIAAAVERTFFIDGVPPRDQQSFQASLERGRASFVETANQLCEKTRVALETYQLIAKRLKEPVALAQVESVADVREQLGRLIYPGFVSETPPQWFEHLPRFLQGIARRLEKIAADPGRDRSQLRIIRPLWEQYLERAEQHKKKNIADPALTEYRWLLEEFRVSLFAQDLRTSVPVSEKRLRQQWSSIV